MNFKGAITFIPFEIFLKYLVGICLGSGRCVAYKNGYYLMVHFYLHPLNELEWGNLVHSIASITFEIFGYYLVGIYQFKTVCHLHILYTI